MSMLAILMLAITMSYAKDPHSTMVNIIKDKVKFPPIALENRIEGTVFVEFKVNEQGKIEVINCHSLEGELQSYVFLTLSGISITPEAEIIGKSYLMRFDFQLL